jgi:ribosomal-protein-alanine N-acetyltransferase
MTSATGKKLNPSLVSIRNQRLSHDRAFFRILTEGEFEFFPNPPATLEMEREFLKKSEASRIAGTAYNFSIMLNEQVVGAVGLLIDGRHMHCGEIGYFVDRRYWGQGIASRAVELAEAFGVQELKLTRLECMIATGNLASQSVAHKNGYEREGLMKQKLKLGDNLHDAYLYAKIIEKSGDF